MVVCNGKNSRRGISVRAWANIDRMVCIHAGEMHVVSMCWDRQRGGSTDHMLQIRRSDTPHVSKGRKRARRAANPVMADESPRRRPITGEQNTQWVSHAGYSQKWWWGIRQFRLRLSIIQSAAADAMIDYIQYCTAVRDKRKTKLL